MPPPPRCRESLGCRLRLRELALRTICSPGTSEHRRQPTKTAQESPPSIWPLHKQEHTSYKRQRTKPVATRNCEVSLVTVSPEESDRITQLLLFMQRDRK